MQLEIDDLIFGYLFVCTLLIAFNIVYIFYSAWNRKHVEKETVKWMITIESLISNINDRSIGGDHLELVKNKAKTTDDLLLSYLEDSSVYCRENVLKALYASGNVQALYNMLSRMEEYRIFHHRKLITDGLITFKGDKKALAEILWSHMDMFGENMKVAIINFITATQEDYGEEFMKALQKKHQNIEVTLSLIRYYRRHYYEPILPLLYDYMNRDVDNSISIVVASVLTKYPMEETREVLKNSIHHTNWYVRLNSATSLVEMNISDEDINSIIDSGDAYAMEILHYVLEENSEEGRINA